MRSIHSQQFTIARTIWTWYYVGALSVWVLFTMGTVALAADVPSLRQVVSLDGIWQVEQGGMESVPKEFSHTVVVPGLVDMAQPAFTEVGVKSRLRKAFWYRRTFRIDGPVPAVAVLKVHKAKYGTRVILNGMPLGDHLPCFTPGYFDTHAALRPGENEILIRVGAHFDSVPRNPKNQLPVGYDLEKDRYIPGIYDSVELILTGSPHIVRVQVTPDIEKKSAVVRAWVRYTGVPTVAKLHFTVREASTGQVVGEAECEIPAAGDGAERKGQATIPIRDCRLWSPEDPFLYTLEVRGDADVLKTRFGMRSFRLDSATGRAILNGRPYFMRGSNVCIYRFFSDSQRGDKPWREEWVRRLHKAFRDMHWNSLRYCIGFPPESWYRIADEQGFLILDEFPIWNTVAKPGDFDCDKLAAEYTEWMQERWNHPCVVVWDGCNETYSPDITEAIRKVRGLDFSNRPWDNGWGPPGHIDDPFEAHPYHFIFGPPKFRMEQIKPEHGTKEGIHRLHPGAQVKENMHSPIIINEYGGIPINRDGTATHCSKDVYEYLLGPNSTTAQRLHLYARYKAALTEFFRSHRAAAAVLDFCGLAYSRPPTGDTSDHWIDVEKLTWEPEFYAYVRDAFAPVGIMIDAWAEKYPPGPGREFPVVVINDLYETWKGTVRFRLLRDGKTITEKNQPCEVSPLGREKLSFTIDIPNQPACYEVEAALVSPGSQPVRSLREFEVFPEQDIKNPASSK